MSEKMHWIKLIYIYLFSVIGLVLVVIGSVRLVDMGLKATVFRQADTNYEPRPMPPVLAIPPTKEEITAQSIINCTDKCEFTVEEKQQAKQWLEDYKKWQEQPKDEVSYIVRDRQRTAASAIAMLLIGLPLYLYHWKMAKKDV